MRALIVGASSAIAQAVAREMLIEYSSIEFVLVARSASKLDEIAADLKVRGAIDVKVYVENLEQHQLAEDLVELVWATEGIIDLALLAHGVLPKQDVIQDDWQAIVESYSVNALSYMALMTVLTKKMSQHNRGIIVSISSVAGDRGRKSNYVYGSAKGAVSLFAQGLRNRLHDEGVHILTVKPGFVDTPMTGAFDKSGFLWVKPSVVARDIVRGIVNKRDVIYTPFYWRYIMLMIRLLPERLFKRLSL